MNGAEVERKQDLFEALRSAYNQRGCLMGITEGILKSLEAFRVSTSISSNFGETIKFLVSYV